MAAERRQGINKAVAQDVQKVFEGKTAEQLDQLQKNIELKLSQKTDGLDINYWESLLSQLKAHLARARLRDKHKDNLRKKLQMLKAEQMTTAPTSGKSGELSDHHDEGEQSPKPGTSAIKHEDAAESRDDASAQKVRLLPHGGGQSSEDPCILAYNSGGYSPTYVDQDDLELGTLVVPEDEDEAHREVDRQRVLRGGMVDNVMNAEEKALEREAKKGMNDDEASFAVESALEQTYEWSDKYRPRKPR